jgi:hypothetical protein
MVNPSGKDGRAKFPGERICQYCGIHQLKNKMMQKGTGHWYCPEHMPGDKKPSNYDWEEPPRGGPGDGPMPI